MAQKTRRIVTGHDENGRSVFIMDGESPNIRVSKAGGGTAVTELWCTTSSPADNTGHEDAAVRVSALEPPAGGSIFRIVEYPPDTVRFAGGDRAAIYREMGAAHAVADGTRHPGIHRTRTVDYAIVLSGEIHAVMDEGQTLMRPGDVLIQRGTAHAWSNRSDRPARVAFVLIDAKDV